MDFEEEDIMEAFGLTDEEEPEKDLDEGTEEPEDEEPEDDEIDPEEEDDAQEPGDEEEPEDPFEQERERIAAQHKADTEAALDAQVKTLGLKNPYRNNEPITTNAQLLQFQQDSRKDKIKRMAAAAGMTEDEVQELIDQHPDVAAGKQLRQQQEEQAREAERQKAERALNAELAEIEKLMPGVGTREGVVSHESWPKVQKLMKDNPNMGVLAAFRSVNAEAIASQMARKAAGAAKRNAASKNHLKSGRGRGEGLPEVPAEVRAIYRAFDPDMSENDMRRAYAASMKKK
jgi:hypothetical protein